MTEQQGDEQATDSSVSVGKGVDGCPGVARVLTKDCLVTGWPIKQRFPCFNNECRANIRISRKPATEAAGSSVEAALGPSSVYPLIVSALGLHKPTSRRRRRANTTGSSN